VTPKLATARLGGCAKLYILELTSSICWIFWFTGEGNRGAGRN
jgi:hypothetical protein